MLPDQLILSGTEYSLAYNAFSFTFAAMFATFVFLILQRNQVAPKYRPALTMSALVVVIAGYHYFRIFESWESAFVLAEATEQFEALGATAGQYVHDVSAGLGEPFNDAYRYIDWLLTVPLLVAELVAVLSLPARRAGWMTFRLATAAALMVILGYPGEIAGDTGTRALWGFISTLPFLWILYELFFGLGDAMERQPGQARVLVRNARLMLLATWGFYPIVFLVPIVFPDAAGNPSTVLTVQIGYAIADILAKCGYGVLIYGIARTKTIEEGEYTPQGMAQPQAAD